MLVAVPHLPGSGLENFQFIVHARFTAMGSGPVPYRGEYKLFIGVTGARVRVQVEFIVRGFATTLMAQ